MAAILSTLSHVMPETLSPRRYVCVCCFVSEAREGRRETKDSSTSTESSEELFFWGGGDWGRGRAKLLITGLTSYTRNSFS